MQQIILARKGRVEMIESVLKSVFGDGKGKGQPEGGAIPVDRPDAILAMMTTTFPGRSVVRKKKP